MTYQPEPKPAPYLQPYAPAYTPPLDPQQLAANQYRQDGEQLMLLSILYYVMGGFSLLALFFPLLYLGIGVAFIGGAAVQKGSDEQAGMAVFGGIIAIIAIPILLLMLIQTICLFLTARNLGRSRSHTFCFINACVLCMHAPFGTALGVFTIIVLSRESVKQRFAMNQYGYNPPLTMQKF